MKSLNEAEVNFFRREKLCRRDYLDNFKNEARFKNLAVLELTFRKVSLGKLIWPLAQGIIHDWLGQAECESGFWRTRGLRTLLRVGRTMQKFPRGTPCTTGCTMRKFLRGTPNVLWLNKNYPHKPLEIEHPPNRPIALYLNTRVVKCKYSFSQK